MTVILVLGFIVCWTPYNATLILWVSSSLLPFTPHKYAFCWRRRPRRFSGLVEFISDLCPFSSLDILWTNPVLTRWTSEFRSCCGHSLVPTIVWTRYCGECLEMAGGRLKISLSRKFNTLIIRILGLSGGNQITNPPIITTCSGPARKNFPLK